MFMKNCFLKNLYNYTNETLNEVKFKYIMWFFSILKPCISCSIVDEEIFLIFKYIIFIKLISLNTCNGRLTLYLNKIKRIVCSHLGFSIIFFTHRKAASVDVRRKVRLIIGTALPLVFVYRWTRWILMLESFPHRSCVKIANCMKSIEFSLSGSYP